MLSRAHLSRWRLVSAAGALVLALAGCSSTGPDSGSDGADTAQGTQGSQGTQEATAPPQGQEALAPYYTQQLQWGACDGVSGAMEGAKCAWLEVPIDYANPGAGDTRLRMLKVPATGQKTASLLVNPGGPGGSAVDYANMSDFVVSSDVRRSHDIVGVDPRGVGHSDPIVCIDPPQLDEMLGMNPIPTDETQFQALQQTSQRFGQACQQKYPQLLPHVSTVDAAKDMDVARAALGDEQLSFLGKSYGTFLGATYAGLFPQRVGRLVLDGALAPDLTNEQMNLGQAVGFETATKAYVQSCTSQGNCPLGSDVDAGMNALRQMLSRLATQPLPVTGDVRVTKLTAGWANLGLARAMYDESSWDALTDALRAVNRGDGTLLFDLAQEYADRSNDGNYPGNMMQVISAVNCLDRGSQPQSFQQLQQVAQRFAQQAPTWGPFMAYGSMTCDYWPVPATGKPEKITAAGAAPIVVVGTTRDPATPYEWAVQLADQLESGRLVTYDGDGHTAYMRSNDCIDKAVDNYLINGTPPDDGLKC